MIKKIISETMEIPYHFALLQKGVCIR